MAGGESDKRMKTRPILFSGAMVRAILAGTKTQTRRAVRRQPISGGVYKTMDDGIWGAQTELSVVSYFSCQYGEPGDHLWVRETWAKHTEIDACTCYRADPGHERDGLTWKPSIHMPRHRCRITLEIVKVRVERLQDISEDDAKAEGVNASNSVEMKDGAPCYSLPYQILWEQINGTGSWAANPWVWVIEFKRL